MKPKTLELLEAIEGRMLFNDDQKRYVWNLQCGYRGECEFVQLMESVQSRIFCCAICISNRSFPVRFRLTFCCWLEIPSSFTK